MKIHLDSSCSFIDFMQIVSLFIFYSVARLTATLSRLIELIAQSEVNKIQFVNFEEFAVIVLVFRRDSWSTFAIEANEKNLLVVQPLSIC